MNTTAALITDPATALAIDPYGLCHLGFEANHQPLPAALESSAEPDPDHL